jgi:N-succinyldiaminopimelate aminotransferase
MGFCRSLPARCGVVAIPSQVMYLEPEFGRPFVRFACCKRLEVLDEAAERLAKLAGT